MINLRTRRRVINHEETTNSVLKIHDKIFPQNVEVVFSAERLKWFTNAKIPFLQKTSFTWTSGQESYFQIRTPRIFWKCYDRASLIRHKTPPLHLWEIAYTQQTGDGSLKYRAKISIQTYKTEWKSISHSYEDLLLCSSSYLFRGKCFSCRILKYFFL